jgi:hypothetical protein
LNNKNKEKSWGAFYYYYIIIKKNEINYTKVQTPAKGQTYMYEKQVRVPFFFLLLRANIPRGF